jgi:putative tryptophan/tyrosine transport system substrate-binding protein
VTAGTLAAAYAAIDDVLTSLDGLLAELEAGRLPEPTYPRFWRVAVNETVARSLNIVVSDDVRHLGNKPPARTR